MTDNFMNMNCHTYVYNISILFFFVFENIVSRVVFRMPLAIFLIGEGITNLSPPCTELAWRGRDPRRTRDMTDVG